MLNLLKSIFSKEDKDKIIYTEVNRENAINNAGEYLSCRYLQGGVTFMHSALRTCCSHKLGVTFVDNYKGEPVDWKELDKVRRRVIENCKKGIIPKNCKGCVDLEKKQWEKHSLIDDIYLNYWDHCNCGCVYCVQDAHGKYLQTDVQPSSYYSALEHIKYLYQNNMVSKNAHVELVGGDLTILDEADEIINICLDYGVNRMSFHSSCIYYSKGIERALKEAPFVDFDFSLDCSSPELYKKIKRTDSFNQVIENVKKYLACSDKAVECLTAKYIIVDGLNDSVEEIDNWLDLVYSIGIRNTKVDVNFKKFFPEFRHVNPTVPPHYYEMYDHYNKKIAQLGIKDHCWEFSKRVLRDGGIPVDY